jgi:CRISPR-associated protein Cas1
MSALASAASLDQIRLIEAQAARVAWPNPPALRWHAGTIPSDWRASWLARKRLDAKTKRGARHPINAILNAAFAVTAGRLAAYLAAAGLSPAIGFLHADKRGRWSLAWDAIEPLRPMIEARAFRLVERERFAASDFIRASDGSLRLAPALLRAVLNECAPPSHTLAQIVRWLARIVTDAGSNAPRRPPSSADVSRLFPLRSAEPVRPCTRLGSFTPE